MHGASVLLGRTFGGKFTIVETLGEGGMGAVLRGVGADGSRAAIKILHPDLVDDPVMLARFEREAHMAAQIDHPNAVRMIDHGTEDGLPYIVMELVEGRELFDVLASEGRLSPARAAAIVIQICDAVATAHDRGIVHRDLKPENVMLTGDAASPGGERVKLLDFGVAKRVAALADEDGRIITVAGAIVGTPAYMSPEQCVGGAVDARSDVYACGALLYHLVTGHAVFEDALPVQTLFRHVHEEPRPPSEVVPGLDRGLEATILKALRKRPEDRHQGAHELWEELLAALPQLRRTEARLVAPASKARPMLPKPAIPRPVPPMRPTWAMPLCPAPAAAPARGWVTDARRTPRLRVPRAYSGMRRWAPVIVGLAAAAGIGIGIVGLMGGAPQRSVPARSAAAPAP
jgi:eukaryotic-like serine/threonine-protein kinase